MADRQISSILRQGQSTVSSENIPLVDMDTQHADRVSPEKRRGTWSQGHNFGLRCCALSVAIVLLFNVITTIIVASKYYSDSGIAVFHQGDCTATKRLTVGLHLLINILGTILLGASNYCMQCVSAPTRSDIDKAHRQSIWMDIGIPSIRNLERISRSRKAIWSLLFISSLPLHLTYNSVIFPSTSIAYHDIFVVTREFLGSSVPVGEKTLRGGELTDSSKKKLTHLRDVKDSLKDMVNNDCRNILNQPVDSTWANILVVSSYENTSTPVVDFVPGSYNGFAADVSLGSNQFLCASDDLQYCNEAEKAAAQGGCVWVAEGVKELGGCTPISHCSATEANQHCSLSFSIPIMVVVIICNIIKLGSMTVLIWKMDSSPLVTLGDAISSFLDNPGKHAIAFLYTTRP